MNQGNITA